MDRRKFFKLAGMGVTVGLAAKVLASVPTPEPTEHAFSIGKDGHFVITDAEGTEVFKVVPPAPMPQSNYRYTWAPAPNPGIRMMGSVRIEG